MTKGPVRPRRRSVLAARGIERRELERRNAAGPPVDVSEARTRLLEHLREARLAALEARMVIVAAQIQGLIRVSEGRP